MGKDLRSCLTWDELELIHEIVTMSEWGTRHAAENTYCPSCAVEADLWKDQQEHHEGCRWVRAKNILEKVLAK